MFRLLMWLILLLVFITPVTIRADLRYAHALDIVIVPQLWGLGPRLRYRVVDTGQGHRLLHLDASGHPKPSRKPPHGSPQAMLSLIRSVLRGDRARRLFLRGVTLQQLDVALNVSFDDAARTALTAGTLQSLWRALPFAWRGRARLRVRPDFLCGQSGAQARCMVFFHLGTLLLTGAMLLMSYAAQRTAHPVHPAKEA